MLREATADDIGVLQRAIHAAWRWRETWDEAAFAQHLTTGRADSYLDGFGRRPGDAGVVAVDGAPLGAAWYRFFSATDHRAGFVDEDVPELVVAVEERARGRGVGRSLVEGLLDLARERGVERVSLHVSRENERARHVYGALGFEETTLGDARGAVLVRSTGAVLP
ncbi:GNAT family N-acetyltransferase [Brachybacterium sacelli]